MFIEIEVLSYSASPFSFFVCRKPNHSVSVCHFFNECFYMKDILTIIRFAPSIFLYLELCCNICIYVCTLPFKTSFYDD